MKERTLDQRDLAILKMAERIAFADVQTRDSDGVGSHDWRANRRYVRLEQVGLLKFDCMGEDDRARSVPIYVITTFGRLVLAQRRDAWRAP
jgi:hypothetical protein